MTLDKGQLFVVCLHFQRTSPLKLLDQLQLNFIGSLHQRCVWGGGGGGGGGRGEREKEKICILGCTERIVSALFETGKEAPVAQWVKCWPTDLAVASSSSARGEIFSTLLVRIPLHTAFNYQPLIVLI